MFLLERLLKKTTYILGANLQTKSLVLVGRELTIFKKNIFYI